MEWQGSGAVTRQQPVIWVAAHNHESESSLRQGKTSTMKDRAAKKKNQISQYVSYEVLLESRFPKQQVLIEFLHTAPWKTRRLGRHGALEDTTPWKTRRLGRHGALEDTAP
jgi:hypothetical protein